MDSAGSLSAIFRRHVAGAGGAGLESTLAVLLQRGIVAHRGVALDPARFVDHLGQHAAAGAIDDLERVFAEDLYLACAAGHGEGNAIATLDRDLLPRVTGAILRVNRDPDFVADAGQALRVDLLVPDGGRAGILRYAGLGPLVAWLRVVATRTATRVIREDARYVTLDTGGESAPDKGSADPELRFLKEEGAEQVERALVRTLAALGDRDRTLLRLYFVEGMSLAALGRVYHVHQTTMVRRVQALRAALLAEIKRELALDSAELESRLALVESRLDMHLERHLR
jgi:RNA polymerase sigma-70 factor (ECF subfamily)